MPDIDAAHLDHDPHDPVRIERLRATSRLHRGLGRPGRSRDIDQPEPDHDRHHDAARPAGARDVHGIARHDPAVRADLFPDHRGAQSVADLVRRHHAAQHGNGRDLAAVRLRAVRHEGGGAARNQHDGRLSCHHSVPVAEFRRHADHDLLSLDGALAAVGGGEIDRSGKGRRRRNGC